MTAILENGYSHYLVKFVQCVWKSTVHVKHDHSNEIVVLELSIKGMKIEFGGKMEAILKLNQNHPL